MKKLAIFFLLLFTGLNLIAQKKTSQPLIIQGRLPNSPERMLKIFFTDDRDRMIIDTIQLKPDGSFYFKTYNITRPQRTSIQQNRTQINQIYVAPGYELTITGDASEHTALYTSKKVTGIGSQVNAYRVKLDSMYASRVRGKGWYEMDLQELLSYTQSARKLQDSIYSSVFTRNTSGDPYFEAFKKMISLDNQSIALYTLFEHINMNKYSYEKMVKLVAENTPPAFKTGISNDSYLNSEDRKPG